MTGIIEGQAAGLCTLILFLCYIEVSLLLLLCCELFGSSTFNGLRAIVVYMILSVPRTLGTIDCMSSIRKLGTRVDSHSYLIVHKYHGMTDFLQGTIGSQDFACIGSVRCSEYGAGTYCDMVT